MESEDPQALLVLQGGRISQLEADNEALRKQLGAAEKLISTSGAKTTIDLISSSDDDDDDDDEQEQQGQQEHQEQGAH